MSTTRDVELDEFLNTRRVTCSTCRNPEWSAVIAAWAEVAKVNRDGPSQRALFEFLRTKRGYTPKLTAMKTHLANCVGFKNAK